MSKIAKLTLTKREANLVAEALLSEIGKLANISQELTERGIPCMGALRRISACRDLIKKLDQ